MLCISCKIVFLCFATDTDITSRATPTSSAMILTSSGPCLNEFETIKIQGRLVYKTSGRRNDESLK